MPQELLSKQMDLASRVVDDNRRVLEIVGTTPAVDRAGESISVDGWMVDAWLKNPVIMFGHDYSQRPVAKGVSVRKDSGALTFRVQFPTQEEAGEWYGFSDSVYRLMKAGFLNASSVGFRPLEWKDDGDADGKSAPVRTYTKQELYELSIVPVPCNPEALAAGITGGALKSCDRATIETILQHETKGADGLKNLGWAERIETVLESWMDTPIAIDDPPEDGDDDEADIDEVSEEDIDDMEDDAVTLRDVYDEVAILTDAVQTLAMQVRGAIKAFGGKLPQAQLSEARAILDRLMVASDGDESVKVGAPAAHTDLDAWLENELELIRTRRSGGKN